MINITEGVEAECPVAKYFGVSGIGEGVVWHTSFNNNTLLFKVKGEKYSSSKVKKLAAVDVEVIKNIQLLVDSIVTENRLTQGIQVLSEQGVNVSDNKATKEFINWIRNDVIKEETDTILASGLDFNKVMNSVSSKAGRWFSQK